MSLRAIAHHPKHLFKAFYNVGIMRYYDVLMRKLKGQAWIDEKNRRAIFETEKRLTSD